MTATIHYPESNQNQNIKSSIYAEFLQNSVKVVSETILSLGKRGVTYNGLVSDIGANGCKNERAGWHSYYLTQSAFNKLKKSNDVVLNVFLD